MASESLTVPVCPGPLLLSGLFFSPSHPRFDGASSNEPRGEDLSHPGEYFLPEFILGVCSLRLTLELVLDGLLGLSSRLGVVIIRFRELDYYRSSSVSSRFVEHGKHFFSGS